FSRLVASPRTNPDSENPAAVLARQKSSHPALVHKRYSPIPSKLGTHRPLQQRPARRGIDVPGRVTNAPTRRSKPGQILDAVHDGRAGRGQAGWQVRKQAIQDNATAIEQQVDVVTLGRSVAR